MCVHTLKKKIFKVFITQNVNTLSEKITLYNIYEIHTQVCKYNICQKH